MVMILADLSIGIVTEHYYICIDYDTYEVKLPMNAAILEEFMYIYTIHTSS